MLFFELLNSESGDVSSSIGKTGGNGIFDKSLFSITSNFFSGGVIFGVNDTLGSKECSIPFSMIDQKGLKYLINYTLCRRCCNIKILKLSS